MKKIEIQKLSFSYNDTDQYSQEFIAISKDLILNILKETQHQDNLNIIKKKILEFKNTIENFNNKLDLSQKVEFNKDVIVFKKFSILSELDQIINSKTHERATYYLRRLQNCIETEKTNEINDINLARWKEYDDIITDSLWILDKRDTSGAHLGWYWGNFIPQIPRQLMLRFTKKKEWVLDPFLGSGTTLIECRRLNRNGIGIELNPEVAQKAKELIEKETNTYEVKSEVVVGDSRKIDIKSILSKNGIDKVQLVILHPPYHDIIKFSQDERDLSNATTVQKFLDMFLEVAENVTSYLEEGRFLGLIIGDKYTVGEWIPLGFLCMQNILKLGYSLKSIVVKNFEETRGKRNQKALWRYRALAGGFYVFKHEYIMLFQKNSIKKVFF